MELIKLLNVWQGMLFHVILIIRQVETSGRPLQNSHFMSSEPVPKVPGRMDWSIILLINPTSCANLSGLGQQCVPKNVSLALRVIRVETSANGSTLLISSPSKTSMNNRLWNIELKTTDWA